MSYYAVIFTSRLAPGAVGYEEAASAMVERVSQMPGFLGFDSAWGRREFYQEFKIRIAKVEDER